MRSLPAVLVTIAACTPRAVAPPVRTFVPDTPSVPAVGKSDLQLGFGAGGSTDLFGPGVSTAAGRVRGTVAPGLALEAEGGVLHVTNSGDGGYPDAYTGRLGVIRSFDEVDHHVAIAAGVGAGLSPTAGNWGSADLGALVAGAGTWVRPLFAASVGYSAPTGNHTFTVTSDDVKSTLRLPRNLFSRVDAGLEIGPRGAFLLGVSWVHFWELTADVVDDPSENTSTQDYFWLGVGARIPL